MQNPLEKFIQGRKVNTHAELANDIITHYPHIPDIQERFQRELLQRLTNEMISNRVNDIKTCETDRTIKYELELFVFNREELLKLIDEVQKHTILNTFVTNTGKI
jgi:hypothetical protein